MGKTFRRNSFFKKSGKDFNKFKKSNKFKKWNEKPHHSPLKDDFNDEQIKEVDDNL